MTPGNLAALGRTYRALNLNVKLLGKERERDERAGVQNRTPTSNAEFTFI